MRGLLTAIFLCMLLPTAAIAQVQQVPPASQQIAAAVLPLPEVMRDHATVFGYARDLSLVTLRQGSNGIVCTAFRPGADEFDVRCYHESFMPVVRRLRDAGAVILGKLQISAYQPATNTVGKEIQSWQSVHFPYRTAAEIGLPEEGQVTGTMPYVMASGTFWSHVMIEHENELSK